jgi:PAS domain S-box-containing protein
MVRFRDSDIVVSHPIYLTSRRIGTLVLLYDLGELYQRMALYGTVLLGILIGSALIALLLSSSLQGVIASPISRLAGTTEAVSRTRDYSLRAEKLSQDELGILVDGFNDMLAGIQSRDQELREALNAREAALKDAQTARDFLSTTLASIGDAVVSTDAGGRVVFANPIACALMRLPEEKIVGRRSGEVLRFINEDSRAVMPNPVDLVLRAGEIVAITDHTLLIAHNGLEVPVDNSAAPILGPNGELVGTVLIFRDITERKRVERDLRAAREQLQLITDTMAPAVSHCGRDLRYLWVSPHYAEWLQLTPAKIAGKPIQEVVGEEAFAVLRPYTHRVLAGERVEYERRVNVARIGTRWVHAIDVPTYDKDGAVTGWVSHVSDITELKDAQAEVVRVNADLKRTNERLARTNKDLEGFAFAASHDLQEPLRMVSTYSQLLAKSFPEQIGGEGAKFLAQIVDGATRMRRLLTDLLAYSEIDADRDEQAGLVDLNQVLDTALQNLRVAVEESRAMIKCDPLPSISGHQGHFVQLFQNLIANAIKYSGDSRPSIQVRYTANGREHRIAVSDNGIGIAPEYHARIFGVFKRLHGKTIPGTGIGLAICQRVVERYRGRIWVESQPGRGATFVFTLPGVTETEEVGYERSV